MVLNYHLIVNLVCRFDYLAFSMLDLQMEHINILGFREIPIEVFLDLFHWLSDHVTVGVEADRLDWIKFRFAQKLLQERLRALRTCRALELLKYPLNYRSIFFSPKEVVNVESWRVGENFRTLDYLEPTNYLFSAELWYQERSVWFEAEDAALITKIKSLIFSNRCVLIPVLPDEISIFVVVLKVIFLLSFNESSYLWWVMLHLFDYCVDLCYLALDVALGGSLLALFLCHAELTFLSIADTREARNIMTKLALPWRKALHRILSG